MGQINTGKLTKSKTTKNGLKVACILAQYLFNIYVELTLKNWNRTCGTMGIFINDITLRSFLFAVYEILFARDNICGMYVN